MNNYKELNFNFPVLRDDFVFPKECPTYHVTMKIDVEKSLHPELIKFFNNLGLNIKAMIFRTPPHNKCSIHVDGFVTHKQWGINWVWGDDHLMSWWKPNSHKISLENFQRTNANTPYLFWKDEDVTLLESVKIVNPVIVKTGVPHRVENFSDTERWCLTVRPTVPSNWDAALKLFNGHIEE
jgi:hypothetical protein